MDLLLILRDALASSFVGTLLTAESSSKAGLRVGVLLTQEALAAVAAGSLEWPRQLSGPEMRLTMADQGKGMGLPLSGRGQGRQLDPKALIPRAQQQGVAVYACPIWTSLLNLQGKLPDGIQVLEPEALPKLLQDAKKLVGTL